MNPSKSPLRPHTALAGRFVGLIALLVLTAGLSAPGWAQEPADPAPVSASAPASSASTAAAKSPQKTSSSSKSAAPAAASTAATPAAAAAAAKKSSPIEADGLVAKALRQLDSWAAGLGQQLRDLKQTVVETVGLLERTGGRISRTSEDLLLTACWMLAAVFACGLLVEWLFARFALRPIRRWLEKRAEAAETREQASDARQEREEAVRRAAEARRQAEEDARHGAPPPPQHEDVALVQTTDGVEQKVEKVPVDSHQDEPTTAPEPAPEHREENLPPSRQHRPYRYIHALRRLMFAFGAWWLDLIPLLCFFVSAVLLLHVLSDSDDLHDLITAFLEAYLSTRVIMISVRLLVMPANAGMRVIKCRAETALILQAWLRVIVAMAAFSIAFGAATQTLGAGPHGRMAFLKIMSLFVHLAAVGLVLRLRRQTRRAISAAAGASGTVATLRNALARAWVPVAIALILGEWIVFALGVEDGFPKLIHFIGVTAAVIVAARILSILLQGVLGRAFHVEGEHSANDPRIRLARTYYPAVKLLITLIITVTSVIVLFQCWGFDAWGWWFGQGGIGRGVTSAAVTILVAAVIAITVWEASSIGIERRIDLWSERGDNMRAARLRTLLPMLRTCLFVAVVIVVGLTALNQIGVNTAPLLASASIIGVALGFGSQKLVQDFITGIFLLMENAMQVGDYVTLAGVSGTVEYLSIRTVRLRGSDGSLYIVPFSSVTTVNNINRGLGNAAVSVSIANGADIDRAFDELRAIGAEMRADPNFSKVILSDLSVWGVDALDASKITIDGQMNCTDSGRWGVQREINRRIVLRFADKGIALANPRATILMGQGVLNPPPSPNDAERAKE